VPVGSTWVSLAHTRSVFERDVMPEHLARSRWYPTHTASSIHPMLTSAIPFCDIGDNRPWLAFFEATEDPARPRYVLPMQIEWVRFDRERYNPSALAAVRQGAREGTLLDVGADPIFIALLLRNLRQSLTIEENGSSLEFRPTSRFRDKSVRQPERITALESAPLTTAMLVDDDDVIKLYRKLESGTNPEIEMGRFLTEVVGFANTPPLLGSVELAEGENRSAIAVVHAQVGNQGDAWTVTGGYLDRFLEEQRLLSANGRAHRHEEQVPYLRHMSQIGRRLAELHLACASTTSLADFIPEPIEPSDVRRWTEILVRSAERAFDTLRQHRGSLADSDRSSADQILAHEPRLRTRLNELLPLETGGLNLRIHGDFHLGRSLIVKDDIFFTGFEGDLRRPIEERRRKAPAARDVASLIWSIEASSQAALERALKLAPDEYGRLSAALAQWVRHASVAFLAAYRELMTRTSIWPSERRIVRGILDFFLLEKALDALENEGMLRPGGARPALAQALRILSQPAHEAA
jgi:maltose alpha-D-glucosyltransferase / alpha-amylase